jgi:hypothetical protein
VIYLWATLIAAVFYAVTRIDTGVELSPDGRFYSSGAPKPRPYSLRWLWPALCGKSVLAWMVLSAVSLIAWGPALAWYLSLTGAAPWQQLFGVALLCGLPGLFRLNTRFPILIDPPAFLLALVSAAFALSGHPAYSVAAALAAGASKESAPIFAAAFALSPWPLIGLVACGWWRATGPIPTWAAEWLRHPVAYARKAQAGAWLDWKVVALPWGAVLPLALCAPLDRRLMLAAAAGAALGYAQMFTAVDRARLFSWAAPAAIALAVTEVPEGWAVPIAAAHALNPYRGT